MIILLFSDKEVVYKIATVKTIPSCIVYEGDYYYLDNELGGGTTREYVKGKPPVELEGFI